MLVVDRTARGLRREWGAAPSGWGGVPPRPRPGARDGEDRRGLPGVSSSAATGGIGSRPSDTLQCLHDASSRASKQFQ